MWWHTVTHGRGSEGETDEWSGCPVPFTLSRNMVYPALLPLMRTPRLPVIDWTDAPVDLNVFVRFAEWRNLVSARVPSHFNWPLHRLNLPNISGRTRLAGNHDLDGQASVRVEPNARSHMPIAGPRLCWLADLRGWGHTSAAVTDSMSIWWSDPLDVGLRQCGFMRSLVVKDSLRGDCACISVNFVTD